ncbi:MAG: glutamate--tRNA ligase family protein [Opitutales bacterium]|jgi:glutamyl-tRNA synthetase
MSLTSSYRGRIAPSPSGFLHIGHARTFMTAYERAQAAGGDLILRVEDLDAARCKPAYYDAMIEDLEWLGIRWTEGPDLSGPRQPYLQSARGAFYTSAWHSLMDSGLIYPSPHSRRDVEHALSAPHEGAGDLVFPVEFRPARVERADSPGAVNWRFRVPDGLSVRFSDLRAGEQSFVAGRDFGDFIIWSKDGWPSYEMAVVVDDFTMGVSEVVRGEDLLLSTARQLLLYRALGWAAPAFYHCPLVRDAEGIRLAKRTVGLTIRELRDKGLKPAEVLAMAEKHQPQISAD